jgi:hypothetical protein
VPAPAVVVDVDDAGLRRDALRDLVHVVRGGQSGSDVEELADADLAGEEGDGAAQEARFSRAAVRIAGQAAATASAESRSAWKLSLPPSQ